MSHRHLRHHCRLRLAVAMLTLLSAATCLAAPYRPEPPPAKPLQLDPDAMTCTPDVIAGAFAQHLRPWADQPPAVLAQLRALQLSMTKATIQRCISQGRLNAEQAATLERELGLEPVGSAVQPSERP